MSHKKIPPLEDQLKIILNQKSKLGESRHEAKNSFEDQKYIYSYATKRTYYNAIMQLIKYAKEIDYETAKLKALKNIAPQFLDKLIEDGKSAYTVSTYEAAIHKIIGDFNYKAPTRLRQNIFRGRNTNYNWENSKLLKDLCDTTGLRRHELKQINKDNLVERHGKYVLTNVKGKGGKKRNVYMLNPSKDVIDLIAKSDKTITDNLNITKRAEIHNERREYATNLYLLLRDKRKGNTFKKYICRKDLSGIVYDRDIMLQVSRNLGHNRIDVIASHYLDPTRCNEITYEKST